MNRYLRDALSSFCDETLRMYAYLIPTEYELTPVASPLLLVSLDLFIVWKIVFQ